MVSVSWDHPVEFPYVILVLDSQVHWLVFSGWVVSQKKKKTSKRSGDRLLADQSDWEVGGTSLEAIKKDHVAGVGLSSVHHWDLQCISLGYWTSLCKTPLKIIPGTHMIFSF